MEKSKKQLSGLPFVFGPEANYFPNAEDKNWKRNDKYNDDIDNELLLNY